MSGTEVAGTLGEHDKATTQGSVMLLSQALQRYLQDCRIGLSPCTTRNYAYNLTRLIKWLSCRQVLSLIQLTVDDLRDYLVELRQAPGQRRGRGRPFSLATIHQVYRTTRTWLNWCVARGYLTANPVLQIRTPELPKPVARHITREAMARLITASAATTRPERDRAIVLLFLDTGIRRQEIARLQASDVDLAARRVTVRVGKGGRGRVLPISTPAAHALASWLVVRPESDLSLFGLKAHGVYLMIRRLQRRAGLEDVSPHVLRHTFATYYDGDVYDLAKILGHRDITVTAEVYAHREVARLSALHDQRSPLAALP